MAVENIEIEIRILSNRICNRLNQMTMEEEMLTIHQYWILQYLLKNGDTEVYQKDIEQLFSIKRSTANQMLRTLEARGCIERRISPTDSRRNILAMTPYGESAYKRLEEKMRSLLEKIHSGIAPGDLEHLEMTMKKLWSNLD